MLEGELDTQLGYTKHDDTNKATDNRRNGHSSKSVRSDYGEVELEVPRDRKGEFEPVIVKKNQRNVTGIEEQIIALYFKEISILFPAPPSSRTGLLFIIWLLFLVINGQFTSAVFGHMRLQ